MRRLLLFAIGALATFQISAQQELHLSVNSGIGKIGYRLYSGERAYAARLEDKYSPTFNINLSYSYGFGDFSIESGLAFNDLKGHQTDGFNVTETLIDGSTRVIKTDIATERKARYLAVPLKLNYRIDRLHIGAGVYLSSLIRDQSYIVEYTDDAYTGSSIEGNGLKSLDFGLSAQVEYELSERARLLFSSSYGLMDISTNSNPGGQYGVDEITFNQRQLRNRQIMLGLKFRLFNT